MGEQWRRFREKLRLCDPVDSSLDGSAILPIVVGEATRWIRLDRLVSIARGMGGGTQTPAPTFSLPPGIIVATLGSPPAGWLKCNGELVLRTQYPKLFAAIGVNFGPGDSATTFQLPDIKIRLTSGNKPEATWIIAT